MVFGLGIGVIGHLRIVTKSNFSSIDNSHNLQFATARIISFQSSVTSVRTSVSTASMPACVLLLECSIFGQRNRPISLYEFHNVPANQQHTQLFIDLNRYYSQCITGPTGHEYCYISKLIHNCAVSNSIILPLHKEWRIWGKKET
jgi:hypothetical protein